MLVFLTGMCAIYPVFAQYKPPVRCKTIFDEESSSLPSLTFEEITILTTETPFCNNFDDEQNKECNFCNITSLDGCEDAFNSFESLLSCTNSSEFGNQFYWGECDEYVFD